ncbi:fasciclin domain-containing protein [Fodinibius sp. AD559]|uniref:fasciclin domain-containing protein n=1 Tax=Fodinibius sp. AD559 TaxID=3424179 RepID=UPI004046E549
MRSNIKRLVSASLAVMLVMAFVANVTVGQNTGQQGQVDGETVVDKIDSNEKLSDFTALVEASGFGQVLTQPGTYTVLAPTNKALENEGVDVDAAKENRKQAQKVVQSHLYQGDISTEKVKSSMGVKIKDKDESAANGTVYIVDQVVKR